MLTIPLFTFIFFLSQPGPAGEPTPWWDQGLTRAAFEDQLMRDVADLGDEETLKLSVGSPGGGLIKWDVHYNQENLLVGLDRRGFEPQTETKRRLLDWADVLNREIFNRTRNAIRIAGHEEDGVLEADFSSSFYRSWKEEKLGGGIGTYSFRGTRLISTEYETDGNSQLAGSSQTSPDGLMLEMMIRPAKSDWAYREPISGNCDMTNRGSRRISIELDHFGRVTVQDVSGKPAPTIQPKSWYCGGTLGREAPVVLRPGESTTRSFAFETDTLSTSSGYELDPGTYSLGWTDLNARLNIPCTMHAATVTVLPPSASQRLARIVEFAAARNRLVITRETGLVEAFDLRTGKRVGRAKIADFVPHEIWNRAVIISPDGSLVAYARPRPISDDEFGVVELHSLDERATRPRLLRIPRERGYETKLLRFSDDSRSLFVRDDRLKIFDITDAAIRWEERRDTSRVAWLSPDGRHLVQIDYKDTAWQSTVSSPNELTCVSEHAQEIFAGLRGSYAWDRGANQVTFHPYNSEPGWSIECRANQLLESPGGRYLGIATYSGNEASHTYQTEIWSTSPPRKLSEFAGTPDFCFTGAPARVVVSRRLNRWSPGRIEPYDPRFEVLDPDSGAVLATITVPASTP